MMSQQDIITKLRQQADDDRQQVQQKSSQRADTASYRTAAAATGTKSSHILLISLCIPALLFSIDYLDTDHAYTARIRQELCNNKTLYSIYEKMENSTFINRITECVSNYINN